MSIRQNLYHNTCDLCGGPLAAKRSRPYRLASPCFTRACPCCQRSFDFVKDAAAIFKLRGGRIELPVRKRATDRDSERRKLFVQLVPAHPSIQGDVRLQSIRNRMAARLARHFADYFEESDHPGFESGSAQTSDFNTHRDGSIEVILKQGETVDETLALLHRVVLIEIGQDWRLELAPRSRGAR